MRRISAKGWAGQCSRLLIVAFALTACSGSSEPDPPTVATVEVTPGTADRQVGETVQLSAALKDASGNVLSGQSVTWQSSATNVASVSGSGLVTAVALGSTTITATSNNKTGVSTINVIPPPPTPIATVTVTPANDTLLVGENKQLAVSLKDANGNELTGRTIQWSSSSTTVASVSNQGVVTGVADGVTTVTAASEGRSGSATIRVFGPCSTALAQVITVGQTVNGALAATDCQLLDDTYADGYFITVTTATNVQIDLTAGFDTYLVLLELLQNGSLQQRAFNDDLDPDDQNDPSDPVDTNSRITFTLLPGGQYFILANSFDANVFGDYTLKVAAAAPFVSARQAGTFAKPGKAPITTLIKSLRVPK